MTPGSATIYQNGSQTFAATVNGSSSGSGFSYQWYTTATAGLMTDTTVAGQAGQSTYCSANAQSTYVPNATVPVTSSTGDSVEVSVFTGPGCATANFIGSIATRISVIPDVSTTAIPVFTTTPYSGTVVLPTGTKLTPDQLSVITSVTSTTPLPSGAFTVTEYANGEQLVQVLSPAGNPMLLGWMDSGHPTINASTTAEVLAFFALGGHLMLNESDRNAMIAGIPQQTGFAALVQAISTEIAANPDAFSTTNANVQAAVAAFYTAVTGLTAPAVRQPAGGATPAIGHIGGAAAKPNSVLPTPSATSAQSGITFTGQDPTQAYATNAFRRRAHVFVLRQNDVTFEPGGPQNYMYTPDAVAVTDFDLVPTVGLTGGVTGAVTDIFKAYFGTQPTAYAPVDSDPFTLPVTSGFDGTTYQVLTVGAGGSGAPSPVTLTPGQKAVLVTTAVNGLVNDALVPFVTNVSFGSGSLTNSSGTPVSGAAAAFQTAFIGSLESQVLALTQMVSGQQDKIVAGDYAGAAKEILFGVEVSKFQDAVSAAISTAVGQSGFNIAAASSALTKFNVVMKAADTGLQGFDSAVYAAQLAQSDNVDEWTLLSVGTKITLVADTPTLNGLGNSGLTTTVLGVSNTNGYSYFWTIEPDVSTNSTIGTLFFTAGATQLTPTSYCSSSPTATYLNTSSAIDALTAPQTDDITVTVYSGPTCTGTTAKPQIGNPVTVSVTTDPTPNITISPTTASINVGANQSLTGTVINVPNTTGYSYMWTVTPVAPSTTVSGTLTEVLASGGNGQTGKTSYCSTSPNATYVSALTTPLTSAVSDLVTVEAFSAAACPSASEVGVGATSTITTTSVVLGITPSNTVINPGGTVPTLTAMLPRAIDTTGYSYKWTVQSDVSGNLGGTLTDTGGIAGSGLTSYCTTSNQATYVSTTDNSLATQLVDTITAKAYSSPGCVAANQVALPAQATVGTEPLDPGTIIRNGYFDGYTPTNNVSYGPSLQSWNFGLVSGAASASAKSSASPSFGPQDPNAPSSAANSDTAGSISLVPGTQTAASPNTVVASGYLSQTFIVPPSASSLVMYISSADGVESAYVNIVSNGVTTNLYSGVPGEYAKPVTCNYLVFGDNNEYSFIDINSCAPEPPWNTIGPTVVDLSAYRGQSVTLQLGGSLTAAQAASLPTSTMVAVPGNQYTYAETKYGGAVIYYTGVSLQ